MQGGPKVAPAAAIAPGKPHTFQPTKLIIRIMLGPGRACDVAKKFVNSWFVIQPWVSTTSWRTSGKTVGKPPKLIEAEAPDGRPKSEERRGYSSRPHHLNSPR